MRSRCSYPRRRSSDPPLANSSSYRMMPRTVSGTHGAKPSEAHLDVRDHTARAYIDGCERKHLSGTQATRFAKRGSEPRDLHTGNLWHDWRDLPLPNLARVYGAEKWVLGDVTAHESAILPSLLVDLCKMVQSSTPVGLLGRILGKGQMLRFDSLHIDVWTTWRHA